MTRFARAKGSKASNERIPEDGTQWSVMKQQMLENEAEKEQAKKRKEFEQKREENYKSFLNEQKQPFVEPSWAEFPDSEDVPAKKSKVNTPNKKEKSKPDKSNSKPTKKNKKSELDEEIDKFCDDSNPDVDAEFQKLTAKLEKKLSESEPTTKSSKRKSIEEENSTDDKPAKKKKKLNKTESSNDDTAGNQKKISNGDVKVKKNKKALKKTSIESNAAVSANSKEDKPAKKNKKFDGIKKNQKNMANGDVKMKKNKKVLKEIPIDSNEVSSADSVSSNKKNKLKKIPEPIENNDLEGNESDEDDAPVEESIIRTAPVENVQTKKKKKQKPKKAKKNATPSVPNEESTQASNEIENKKESPIKNTPKGGKNEKMKQRRKPEHEKKDFIIVNGEKHEIVMYGGFPVKKIDAERLQKLKTDMIKKGIPRQEVFHTMKLERRKAEKALTRDKKKVCFQCRKAGHLLSDCPELGSKNSSLIETNGSGICFKCGSTEHTSFDCRVVKGNTFGFAKCFICGEQGHISRQCPDNPRGLYPQGGGCRICGDVTHLKKDCPQFQQTQEDNTLTLNTLSRTSNVEDEFDDGNKSVVRNKPNVVGPKIVKF